MFCFDVLNNNLYITFYCEKFAEKKYICYLCTVDKKQIKCFRL